jgi:hypothetical protein
MTWSQPIREYQTDVENRIARLPSRGHVAAYGMSCCLVLFGLYARWKNGTAPDDVRFIKGKLYEVLACVFDDNKNLVPPYIIEASCDRDYNEEDEDRGSQPWAESRVHDSLIQIGEYLKTHDRSEIVELNRLTFYAIEGATEKRLMRDINIVSSIKLGFAVSPERLAGIAGVGPPINAEGVCQWKNR